MRGGVERVAESLPFRDAAINDMDHLLGAVALDQAGGGRGSLAGSADTAIGRSGSSPSGSAVISCHAVNAEPGM